MPTKWNIRRDTGAIALAMGALACAGMIAPAMGQSKKMGAYEGTVEVSESTPALTYRARAKVIMPVSDRSGSSINAEFLAGEAPNATVLVTQWDTFQREKSADSGGQFNTLSCSLAAPVEIPMTATGVLNVDLKKKTHALSLTLVSNRDVAFNCVQSRSGAHKKKGGIAMTMGTGAPGMHYETQLPFSDAARLNASYTLMPTAATRGEHGPIVQVWDLKQVP